MLEIIQKLIIDWLNLQKYENIYFKNLIPLAWVFGGSSEFKNILEFFKALLLPLTKRLEFSLNWGNYIALNQAPKTCQERSICVIKWPHLKHFCLVTLNFCYDFIFDKKYFLSKPFRRNMKWKVWFHKIISLAQPKLKIFFEIKVSFSPFVYFFPAAPSVQGI